MADPFVTILVPVIVATVPSAFLLLSKKFEHAEQARGKIYDSIRELAERISRSEGDIQNIRGRLNGMSQH